MNYSGSHGSHVITGKDERGAGKMAQQGKALAAQSSSGGVETGGWLRLVS